VDVVEPAAGEHRVAAKTVRVGALLAAACLAAPTLALGEDVLRLPIGDPARRDREARLVLDAVTDTSSGALLTPAELAARLSDARIVLVGEGHTDMETHRVERRILDELDRAGRRVRVGLEMYPYPEQKWLDEWTEGRLSEDAFLEGSRWYANWGYNWLYYRDIFLLARDRHLRMFAVNAPREVVAAVRQKGFQGLTPEEAAHIPTQIDTKSPDHLRLFKAEFAEASFHMGGSDEQWQAMLNAQCTWDATMGWNAVAALGKDADPKTVMVVLVGAGHVQYGLGIARQARQWFSGRIASVIPVAVEDDQQSPVRSVQASYADFVWGIPAADPLYPDLGLATHTRPDDRLEVLDVEKDTPAAAAAFQAGDVLLAMDGVDLGNRETLARLVAGKSWGDAATFTVRRGDATVSVPVLLRRAEPKTPPAKTN
jgi:uncharacterized iron-regulated protein